MKIVITVPGHLTNNPRVVEALGRLLAKSRGCTICPAQGQWIDQGGRNVLEPVEQHHFCFAGPAVAHDWGAIDHAVRCVVMALYDVGEQAVMVERFGRSYLCTLYIKENTR
jgi:hypothetical protein